jgi:hypothetical protein
VKYVLVLVLLTAVGLLVYWRLRPYVRMARRFLGVMREMRRMSGGAAGANSERARRPPAVAPNERLLRCAACGAWMPASRAVRLRATNASYCSHACLERSADSPRATRKSAS